MIGFAFLLAASAVPQSLLDAADEAALAHTECEFATFRASNQAHLSPEAFERKLRSDCSAQAQRLRTASTRIFSVRGDSNPGGKADRMIEEDYRAAVEDYRRFPEKEKLVRDFCKADPKDCG